VRVLAYENKEGGVHSEPVGRIQISTIKKDI
jgi:hypothetical protein